MFYSFFSSHVMSWYLSLFSLSIRFTLLSSETANSTTMQVLFLSFFLSFFLCFCFFFFLFSFFFTITRYGRLAEIKWPVCITKSHWSLCVSFSRIDSRLCVYQLFVWSNFNFLYNSLWITLPIPSCLVLNSFYYYYYDLIFSFIFVLF